MTQKYIKEWVANQDWSKSDAEISRITRVAYITVRARRITAGIFRKSELPEWTLDQDWSLCDAEIARQRGMAYHKVRNLRISLNIPPGTIGKQSGPVAIARLTKVNKHSIDWTMNDATIARTHSISRERARQLRKELNAPKSPFFGIKAP